MKEPNGRRTVSESAKKRLYPKFRVERVDGKDVRGGDREDARYFVLDYVHDHHARRALFAYADSLLVYGNHGHRGLALDLLGDLIQTGSKKHGEDPPPPYLQRLAALEELYDEVGRLVDEWRGAKPLRERQKPTWAQLRELWAKVETVRRVEREWRKD